MKRWNGTYTVEAAFLTGIILILLQLLIMTALTLHDRAAAYETAQLHLLRYQEEQEASERKKAAADFLQDVDGVTVYRKVTAAGFEQEGLHSLLRYEIDGEAKTVTAAHKARPLVFLRAVRGIIGRKNGTTDHSGREEQLSAHSGTAGRSAFVSIEDPEFQSAGPDARSALRQ